MLDYFRVAYPQYGTKQQIYQWNYFSNNIKKDTLKVIKYFRDYPQWINSNHLLAQFIMTLDIPYSLDDYDFYYAVKEVALYKSILFGMTSSMSSGIVHNGSFYGNDKDIIVAKCGSYNPIDIANRWASLEPCKVIKHQYNYLDYQPVDNRNEGMGGINVIIVDLVLLMFQYRGFLQYQHYLLSKGYIDSLWSMSSFLFKYPLANMLKSHNERVIINILLSYVLDPKVYRFGTRNTKVKRFVPDYDRQIREAGRLATLHIQRKGWSLPKVLGGIPTLYHSSLIEYSKYPEMEINRQNSWAMVYSSLSLLTYGLLMGGIGTVGTNRGSIYSIDRTLLDFRSDNIWKKSTCEYIKKYIKAEVDYLEEVMDIQRNRRTNL